MATIAELKRELRATADPRVAEFVQGYFKTEKGQYAEGDRFLGIRVPALRRVAKLGQDVPITSLLPLLRSTWHEERLLALVILANAHRKAEAKKQVAIHRLYLANTRYINNWDLVDSSAQEIVGPHVDPARPDLLVKLAKSDSLWERRIAMIATQYWIRRGELRPTFRIATLLLRDGHDLIHKAAGWMLREAGQKNRKSLEQFLTRHASTMPRTMLRYALERLPPHIRRRFMALGRPVRSAR